MKNNKCRGCLLIAALACLLAFLSYYAGVYHPAFDAHIAAMVRDIRRPVLDLTMSYVTWLGNWQVKFPAAVLAAAVLARRRHRRQGGLIIASALGGEIIVGLVKAWLKRPRPPAPYPISFPQSYGFPSDHAFAAISVYGLILYFACRDHKSRSVRIAAVSGGLVLAIMLGFSRVYLGVHWTTDVLGGYALGAAWTTLLLCALSPSSQVSPCSGSR